MKTVAAFVNDTLVGGLLVILPLAITAALLAKGVAVIHAILAPVATHLPRGVEFTQIIAFVLVVCGCFLAGARDPGRCSPASSPSGSEPTSTLVLAPRSTCSRHLY